MYGSGTEYAIPKEQLDGSENLAIVSLKFRATLHNIKSGLDQAFLLGVKIRTDRIEGLFAFPSVDHEFGLTEQGQL